MTTALAVLDTMEFYFPPSRLESSLSLTSPAFINAFLITSLLLVPVIIRDRQRVNWTGVLCRQAAAVSGLVDCTKKIITCAVNLYVALHTLQQYCLACPTAVLLLLQDPPDYKYYKSCVHCNIVYYALILTVVLIYRLIGT